MRGLLSQNSKASQASALIAAPAPLILTDTRRPSCHKAAETGALEILMTETLEIVTFRLKPGTEAGFVANNGLMTDWLARQPDFLSRQLGRREDGVWVDVVRWQSLEQAKAAADRIMAEIGGSEAVQAIDPASVNMMHAEVALSMP
jgi:hypothetical protein